MLAVFCALLILCMLAGLWRVLSGPSIADRLLGLQMNGTTGIALLLVLSEWVKQPHIRDVAVVLALLAAGIALALVQIARALPAHREEDRE